MEMFGLCLGVCLLALLSLVPEQANAADEIVWTDASSLTVEGKGWTDTESFYDRLPAKAKGLVPDAVWELSHDTTGFCFRFQSDAPVIHMKWDVRKSTLALPHMPATGVSGLDLYAREADGGWRYIGNGRPLAQSNEATFYSTGLREFALYLPLYNGVTSVMIGVPAGSILRKSVEAPRGKPIVFYGTSITQGGCASRPGMSYTAIVGRKLNMSVINLGFSGSGQSEPALADLLAELDPSVYVLDALWNMSPEMVRERIVPFVHKLRAAHPTTPILLAEDCTIRNTIPTGKGTILREKFEQLKQEGVSGLYFVSADGMMGPNDEGTVDGCHPTDLGFTYQAEVFTKALQPILAAQP